MMTYRATRSLRLLLALGLVGAVPAPGPAAAGSIPEQLLPAVGTLFGAYRQPRAGWSADQQKASITKLEGDLDRRLDIDQHYYRWDQSFPGWIEAWDLANGRIPMVSWGGVSTKQVNSGSKDAWIRAQADRVKLLGGPLLVRWFAEMDGAVHTSDAGSFTDFSAAWRRIRGIFQARGAKNALWVWCPNAFNFAGGRSQGFYPGDAYVDWICADGYNWAPGREGAKWTSFADVFSAFYAWASPRGKPLMIGETGVLERSPGEKAAWIAEAAAALKGGYPAIRAFVYFDAKKTETYGTFDWRVDSTASSYEAYVKMARDPYFNALRVNRPEAMIKWQKRSGYVGDAVYNETGKLQTRGTTARAGRRRVFEILVRNHGNVTDSFLVGGRGPSRTTAVRYLVGGQDVTRRVHQGTYTIQGLDPGASATLQLVLRPRSSVPVGWRVSRKVTVSSMGRPAAKDVVRARVRVIG